MGRPKITNGEQDLAAVRKCDMALVQVPWGQLNLTVPATAEVCLEAVRQVGFAIESVPWGQLNLTVPAMVELCLEAVKGIIKNVLERIPGVLHDEVLRAL